MDKTKKKPQASFQDFQQIKTLGRGGFATVYEAEYHGKLGCFPKSVAIKEISKADNNWKKFKGYMRTEIQIHRDSCHRNIVKLYDVLEDDNKIWLILELCRKGSLESYLKKRKVNSDERQAYEIFNQIVEGVKYLHSKYTVHRDLTLRNILLTEDKQVKIADFGLSTKLKEYDDKKFSRVGTTRYLAPEMNGNKGHNDKVDCWNLGCIFYALLFGKIPDQNEFFYPDHITSEAKALLEGLREKNPIKRMCIEAVSESAFFKKYEDFYRSQKDACRSRDCGNGSNNYTKGKESPARDSGFNSKDFEIGKKSHSAKNVSERLSYKKNGTGSNNCHTPICECSSSKDRRPRQPFSSNNASLQIQNASRDCYKAQDRWKVSDSCTNSTYKTYRSPETINHFKDPSSRFDNSIISEWNKVSSSTCSHVGFCDNKCSHTGTCKCHYHSNQKRQHSNCTNPEKLRRDLLEQNPPLNATRLKPKRHYIRDRNIVVHISADRLVILESLKTKKNKTYVSEVIAISTDGMEIKVYNPPKHSLLADNRPPSFPSDPLVVKYYNYPYIAESYWKKYLIAKKFVDTLRAKTPKLILNGTNAKFYVMENSPDPDCRMDFYDGGCVIEKSGEIFIPPKSGKRLLESSKETMKDEFRHVKEHCKNILEFHESLELSTFPIILGLVKSDLYGSGMKDGKENHAPFSSMTSKYNKNDDR